ncbi:hypothetical protein I553_8361 [Mycobacterium xenopi 4042]|uniref:Uncharacterized protein n=1 Tax=Mycobacterium xenopi 4042 TaxID=1299334 RepID=X8BIT5_MYCXE|nr:hypothetical protein I552_8041 [Mycobacterium xenopi 3993]EUA44027.1 hypothetical protein I553_8361 [Mycobacterium xenopi 4042]
MVTGMTTTDPDAERVDVPFAQHGRRSLSEVLVGSGHQRFA